MSAVLVSCSCSCWVPLTTASRTSFLYYHLDAISYRRLSGVNRCITLSAQLCTAAHSAHKCYDSHIPHARGCSYKSSAVAEMGNRLATIDMGRKVGVGAAVSLSVGEVGSPSNTMGPGPRPTSVPSGILIHPTVRLQYTNVSDRTDNGLIA